MGDSWIVAQNKDQLMGQNKDQQILDSGTEQGPANIG